MTLTKEVVNSEINRCIERGLSVEVVLLCINENRSMGFESLGKLEDYFYTRLTIKTIDPQKAASLLMTNDLYDDAISICRSILENYICVRYATVVRDDFIERFCKYHQHYGGVLLDRHRTYKGETFPDEWAERIEDIKKKVEDVKGLDSDKNWKNKWKKSWLKMCECIDEAAGGKSDGKVGTAVELYNLVYRMFSEFTHGAPSEWSYKISYTRKQMFLKHILLTNLVAFRTFQIIGNEYNLALSF